MYLMEPSHVLKEVLLGLKHIVEVEFFWGRQTSGDSSLSQVALVLESPSVVQTSMELKTSSPLILVIVPPD